MGRAAPPKNYNSFFLPCTVLLFSSSWQPPNSCQSHKQENDSSTNNPYQSHILVHNLPKKASNRSSSSSAEFLRPKCSSFFQTIKCCIFCCNQCPPSTSQRIKTVWWRHDYQLDHRTTRARNAMKCGMSWRQVMTNLLLWVYGSWSCALVMCSLTVHCYHLVTSFAAFSTLCLSVPAWCNMERNVGLPSVFPNFHFFWIFEN